MSGNGMSWTGSDVAVFDGLEGLGLDGSNLGLLFSGARQETGGFDSPYDGVLMFSADGTTWESWSIQDILNHPWHMPEPPALGKDRIVIAQQDPPPTARPSCHRPAPSGSASPPPTDSRSRAR